MALNETEVQKQLQHMMAFIEQEANEKAEEIDAKAEEEFNIEKGRLVQQQRAKIMEYFEKKEKQVELQKRIQNSNMINQARLKMLKAREDHVKNVLDEARAKLVQLSNDPGRYKTILRGLISQALFQLLEDEVTLRCRQKDLKLVQEALPECLAEFREKSGKKCALTLDQENFLSPDTAGGVEVLARMGKIKVVSTLESRLDLISYLMVPHVRTNLFGANNNRKFMD